MPGVAEAQLAEVAQLSSFADETPEGRSMSSSPAVRDPRARHEWSRTRSSCRSPPRPDERRQPQRPPAAPGAGDAIIAWVGSRAAPPASSSPCSTGSDARAAPIAVARGSQVIGVIYLKDTIKEGMRQRFDDLRAIGI